MRRSLQFNIKTGTVHDKVFMLNLINMSAWNDRKKISILRDSPRFDISSLDYAEGNEFCDFQSKTGFLRSLNNHVDIFIC